VNGLSNLHKTYWEKPLAPVDDLFRFWRSKVKVTAGRRGGKGIHVHAGVLKSYLLVVIKCNLCTSYVRCLSTGDCLQRIGNSFRGWVETEAQLDYLMTCYKQATSTYWGTRQSPSRSMKTTRLMWKSQYVPFDGIPFINIGTSPTVPRVFVVFCDIHSDAFVVFPAYKRSSGLAAGSSVHVHCC